VRGEQAAEADERPHDLDIDQDGTWSARPSGEQGHALLGEGVGELPAARPSQLLKSQIVISRWSPPPGRLERRSLQGIGRGCDGRPDSGLPSAAVQKPLWWEPPCLMSYLGSSLRGCQAAGGRRCHKLPRE
jgi:hypothetical protein